MMLMAGSMGMPFIPVKDMAGSDLLNVKSFMGDDKYKIIESPFDGKPVVLVPAPQSGYGYHPRAAGR